LLFRETTTAFTLMVDEGIVDSLGRLQNLFIAAGGN
jgi:hypothetical protein